MPVDLLQEELIENDDRETVSLSYVAEQLTHKLRNPLSVITTAANQLKATSGASLDEYNSSLIEALLTAADRLEDILNAFMQFAHPQAIDRELIDINGICRAEMKYVAYDFADFGYELDLFEDMPEIECDPNQVRLILGNVLRNSFQSLRDDSQKRLVRLTTRVVGTQIIIEIADAGDGISPDDLGEVFKPFYSNRAGCMGLGLASARRLVQLNSGKISINSSSGEGTRVTIELPLRMPRE